MSDYVGDMERAEETEHASDMLRERLEVVTAERDQARADIEKARANIRTLEAQLRTAYGYGSDNGAPPWMR